MALIGGLAVPLGGLLVIARHPAPAGVEIGQFQLGARMTLLRCLLIAVRGLPVVLGHATLSGRIPSGQQILRFSIAAPRRLAQPQQGFLFAGRQTGVGGVQHRQLQLRLDVILQRRPPEPLNRVGLA